MSYISILRKKEKGSDRLLVWERVDGKRISKYFDTKDYLYFYIEDENGKYTSIYGKKLSKLTFKNSYEFYQTKEEYKNNGITLYESDINPELKFLSTNYYEKPSPKLNITYYDIEVDSDPNIGYSNVANPYAPINAITLYHEYTNRLIALIVLPEGQKYEKEDLINSLNKNVEIPKTFDFDLFVYTNEIELLNKLIIEIQDSDGLVGWNSSLFDLPYICKRIELVLGNIYLKKMSFEGGNMPTYTEINKFGSNHIGVELSGRLDIDYLNLFEKYEQEKRPSYKLESIADEIVPELPKLKYEGSLHSLYRKDLPFFIRYNIRDVECLIGFEKKLGYVKLSNEMYHMSTGFYKHVTGTLKLSDLSCINYCHYKFNVIVPDFIQKTSRKIKGAYVLLPQSGMHDWISSIDIKSLYPSAIISINMSPETLMGQFKEEIKASEEISKNSNTELTLIFEDNTSMKYKASEWREFFISQKWAVSGFGTVFDQSKKGIMPTILEDWYEKRNIYKKNMKQALAKNDIEKYEYYDRLQYVMKIKLNSFYGAVSNEFFRFYDLRLGESTTGTGRIILTHQCRKVSEILEGSYDVNFPLYYSEQDALDMNEPIETALLGPIFKGEFQSKRVIASDTDSCYFTLPTTNKEDAINTANDVADKVNKSFPNFMKNTFLCNDGYDNKISCTREMVASRGIFIEKKRYILRIVDDDGKSVDKLKIMGVELKKTTLPVYIKKQLINYIKRLLGGENWKDISKDIVQYKKELIKIENIMNMGLPKGIKGLEHYTNEYSKTGIDTNLPGHVAASIHWNLCLEQHNDKESQKITSGMKIKIFYLTKKLGKFKSIAIPTDIEVIPKWFEENFISLIDIDAQLERLIDKPLENIVTCIGEISPSEQSMFTDDILEY